MGWYSKGYKAGDPYVICMRCGRRKYASETTWVEADKIRVCNEEVDVTPRSAKLNIPVQYPNELRTIDHPSPPGTDIDLDDSIPPDWDNL